MFSLSNANTRSREAANTGNAQQDTVVVPDGCPFKVHEIEDLVNRIGPATKGTYRKRLAVFEDPDTLALAGLIYEKCVEQAGGQPVAVDGKDYSPLIYISSKSTESGRVEPNHSLWQMGGPSEHEIERCVGTAYDKSSVKNMLGKLINERILKQGMGSCQGDNVITRYTEDGLKLLALYYHDRLSQRCADAQPPAL